MVGCIKKSLSKLFKRLGRVSMILLKKSKNLMVFNRKYLKHILN
jgi:hypothetical protein